MSTQTKTITTFTPAIGRLQLKIPFELHAKLKALALQRSLEAGEFVSLSDLCAGALEQLVAGSQKKK